MSPSAHTPAARGAAELVVHLYRAVRVGVDARGVHLQLVAVGDATGGHQEDVAVDGAQAPVAREVHTDPGGGHRHAVHLCAQRQVEPVRGLLGEPLRDVVVLRLQQPVTAVDDGDLRAQCFEHVAEFGGDEPAAEDDEVLRLMGDAQDAVAGVERHVVDARHIGDERARAGGDDDLLARDANVAHLEFALADEVRRVLVDVHVGQAVAVLAATFRDGVDAVEHAMDDGRPVGAEELGANAEALVVLRVLREVGGVDEHLRGNAATVQAGAAEQATLHHGDAPAVHLRPDDRVAGPGADDDQVVVLRTHPLRLPRDVYDAVKRGIVLA
jgi:hypothetical protein